MSTVAPPVSLGELLAHLNDPSVGDDSEELGRTLKAATRTVERRVGAMTPRTVTQVVSGRPWQLREYPLLSVTSAVPARGGTPVDLAFVDVDLAAGLVTAPQAAAGSYAVTYRVGYDEVPEDLQEAVLIVAAQLWETQRGTPATRPGMLGEGNPAGGRPVGFALPNRAVELMAPYTRLAFA